MTHRVLGALMLCLAATGRVSAQSADRFTPVDVFELERAVDPQISPDGSHVVYVRTSFDIMTDRTRRALWIVEADGSSHRPLVTGDANNSSPRWSPDGSVLAFVRSDGDDAQIYVRWIDTGLGSRVTNVVGSPGALAWSPDGSHIAFTMFVPHDPEALDVDMPERPDGADWGPPIDVIDALSYRQDGEGYVEEGNTHVFIVPIEGGTARQVSSGARNFGAPDWTPDGRALIVAASPNPNLAGTASRNSDIYEITVADGRLRQLTDRFGPDHSPAISPDGRRIAYVGFDDRFQGYQVSRLYVMNRDGSGSRIISEGLDRDVENPRWSADGRGLFFQFDDEGNAKVGFMWLDGRVEVLAQHVGGLSMGRPYGGGQYSVASNGAYAYTLGLPLRPADVAIGRGLETRQLTHLNDDLLGHKELGNVEELWYESSYDGRPIHGWIITPPGFDPSRTYPLVLEIHGGPFSSYGPWFAPELQLYAAAGYVVLYTNPRGSTSYGEEFGNLIHHAYPSQDFDDLMSGVDAVIAQGYVDEEQLYVTGGSGGGVLTAWIVGHTNRFRAAVSQKPVINWYSFVLNADGLDFFWKYWFPGPPWEHTEHYMARSPIAYAGNVTTPTMLLTGEEDWRTPMSETEQFYGALKIRGVETAMVRIPDASHGIAGKPSNLIAKVQHILAWFDKFKATPREISDERP